MNDHPVVIVTGASRGLGAAISFMLAKAGANLAIAARSEDGLHSTGQEIEKIGSKVHVKPMDVSDPEACKSLIAETVDYFGKIDGIVNDAAIVTPLSFIEEADDKAWRYSLEVNLLGPYYMAKYSLPELRRHKGRIINVSSGAANISIAAASAYCASKAALNHFTAVLAEEEPDIIAISVKPGVVNTDMQTFLRTEGPYVMPEETAAFYRNLHDQNMLEPPEIPARSIAWLSLYAPYEMSGEFRSYDDPDIMDPASAYFRDNRTA